MIYLLGVVKGADKELCDNYKRLSTYLRINIAESINPDALMLWGNNKKMQVRCVIGQAYGDIVESQIYGQSIADLNDRVWNTFRIFLKGHGVVPDRRYMCRDNLSLTDNIVDSLIKDLYYHEHTHDLAREIEGRHTSHISLLGIVPFEEHNHSLIFTNWGPK